MLKKQAIFSLFLPSIDVITRSYGCYRQLFFSKTNQSMQSVSYSPLNYITNPRINVCDLIWQIRHNYNRLDDGHCDITGHRKMPELGTAGAMVTIHDNSVMI